jgi:AcrR family transcriptional regulator
MPMAYRRTRLMEERLAGNRERILRATRRLIAEGGFRNAQIAAVAAQAEVSTGTIYRYFPSKAELFVEVLTEAVDHEIEILRDVIAVQTGARAQLEAAVASFVRRALTGPNLAWAFIAEPAEPEVDAERIRGRKRFGDVFKAVLKRGVASGEFPRQDLDAGAACIVGAFTEALVGPIGPSRKTLRDKERLVRAICDFCTRAVSAAA